MFGKCLRQSGILLIIVLFIMVFLVMFAAGICITVVNQQRYTSLYVSNVVALRAADAGIAYARARLQSNFYWQGYSSTANPLIISDAENSTGKIEIREHFISGDKGCVEGKISMGDRAGYFDFYFSPQPQETDMEFFKQNGEAGPMPGKIMLCSNNIDNNTRQPVYYSDFQPVPGKMVPPNSLLIVCRGVSGPIARTIETSFRIGPGDDYNAVVIGRGDISITHCGKAEKNEKIVLDNGDGGKPSIMRAVGNIDIFLDSAAEASYSPGFDYLTVGNKSGGIAQKEKPHFRTADPLNGKDNFTRDDNQDAFMPKFTLDKAMPGAEQQQSFPVSLAAGTYVITGSSSTDTTSTTPVVRYIKADDPKLLTNTAALARKPSVDMSSTFAEYIAKGYMQWDAKSRRLILLDSCRVNPLQEENLALNSINFTSVRGDRITLQLGPDPEEGKRNPPVYLVNNIKNENDPRSGSVYVNGQLSGIGSVICNGNIDMEAESQLYANELNGVNLYAGGSITIHDIKGNPKPIETSTPGPGGTPEPQVTASSNPVPEPTATSGDETEVPQRIYQKIVDFMEAQEEPSRYWNGDCKYIIGSDYFDAEELAYLESLPPDVNCYDPCIKYPILTEVPTAAYPTGKVLAVDYYTEHYNHPNWYHDDNAFFFAPAGLADRELNLIRPIFIDDNFKMADYTPTGPVSSPSPSGPPKYDFKGRLIDPRDSIFRGLVYACKNFKVDSPYHSFILEGGLVAFGGDTGGNPIDGSGKIEIKASDSLFRYDTRYLTPLAAQGDFHISTLYWTIQD